MTSLPPDFDPSTTSFGVPPPGSLSNFQNPPSQAWVVEVSVYITLPLMIGSFVLRLLARLRTRQLGVDDYICFAAAIVTVLFNAFILAQYWNGIYGRHWWDIPISAVNYTYLVRLVGVLVTYNIAAMLIKISLFALYLRLFNPSKIANFLIWLGLSFVSAFYLVSSIVTLVFCVPHAGDGGWGSPKSFQRCALPQTYTVVAAGVVGTVVDFYILCIPLRMVSKLMLSFRKKIAIASIFLTGLVACTFSIVGTYFRFQILDGVQPMDYTWSAAVAQGLSAIELNIGLVCCCLPVSAVIWKRLYQGSRGFWDYLKGYFQSVSGIRTTGHLSQNGVQLKPNFHDRLPEIPGAQLTWLHSFFRRTLHTLPSHNNIDVSTHGSTDIESSTGLDYHNHLKGGSAV